MSSFNVLLGCLGLVMSTQTMAAPSPVGDGSGRVLRFAVAPGAGVPQSARASTGSSERILPFVGTRESPLPEAVGEITGSVIGEDGEPLEVYSVQVHAENAEGVSREESYSGVRTFALGRLPPGSYELRVSAPAHLVETREGVSVSPGNITPVGTIRVRRGGTLRGTVRDPVGTLLSGARVSALDPESHEKRVVSTTDEHGAFELQGVPPGAIDVLVQHQDFPARSVRGLDLNPPQGPTEVHIALVPWSRLDGWVRSRDSEPGSGRVVDVRVTDELERETRRTALTDAEGAFHIENLPPGHWVAALRTRQGRPRLESGPARRELEVQDGETAEVELMCAEVRLSGRVLRSGTPVPEVAVRLSPRRGGRRASDNGNEPPESITGPDGGYELTVEEPGPVRVEVRNSDGQALLMAQRVEIPDSDFYAVDLELPGQLLRGVVRAESTGLPVAEAQVFGFPRRFQSGGLGRASTDLDGRFEMGLQPGEYGIRAQAPGFRSQNLDVTIGEGDAATVELVLTPSLAISGKVVDSDGDPVSASLWAASEGLTTRTTSGVDGTFELTGLVAGQYNLFARTDTGSFAFQPSVPAGTEALSLVTAQGGRLRLEVRGEDGAPAPGAQAALVQIGEIPVFAMMGRTNSEGKTELPVPAGTLTVRVTRDRRQASLNITVASGQVAAAEVQLSSVSAKP